MKLDRIECMVTSSAALSRRAFVRASAFTAGALAMRPVPSARGSTPVASGKRGGRIITAEHPDAETLDPHRTVATDQFFRNVIDPLIARAPGVGFDGIVAESWEISEDGLDYTFRIRKGLKFHDGSDVTAEDVKFSFDRAIDPNNPSLAISFISALKSTELVDADTVKLILSEPSAPFLATLTLSYFGVLPRGAVEALGDDFGRQPIGSGPWKFNEWVPGQHISFVRNDEYQNFRSYVDNDGPPFADELVFRIIPEAQTEIAALRTGELNHLQLPDHEIPNFEGDADFTLQYPSASTSIWLMYFNTLPPDGGSNEPRFKPPLDDLRVRQAVAHGLDVDAVIESVLNGLGIRVYAPIPTGWFAYDPAIEAFGYPYDPARAQQLLEEAGWSDSNGDGVREKGGADLELTLFSPSEDPFPIIAQVYQAQLAEIGIRVAIEVQEPTAYDDLLSDGEFHLAFDGWGALDPDILYFWATGLDYGPGHYHPDDYMDLLTQARQLTDLEERKRLYFEASKVFLEDLPFIPLLTKLTVHVTARELQGFKFGPEGYYNIWEDIWFEE